MAKIFHKKDSVKLEVPEGSEIVSLKLSDEARKELESKSAMFKFPYSKFKKYLRGNKDITILEDNLKNVFFEKLPHDTICKNCQKHNNPEIKQHELNCSLAWLEYQTLYLIAGNNLVAIIEANSKVLRKEVKQRLIELFYARAFEFENANSFFKVGEMVKFMLKEGLKETSFQLGKMEINIARSIASTNYHAIKEKLLLTELGEPGFEDFQTAEKKYWKNKKKALSDIDNIMQPSLKTTYKTTLSDNQLKAIFTKLINEPFLLHPKSSYKLFKDVFGEVDIITIKNKIIWLGANNLLAYFIDALIRENYIDEGNHWDIAKHCFTNSENLANASVKYKETRTGQPKKADIINEILKGL